MSDYKQQGHLCAFITIFIWGTTFISTKLLLADMTPLQILFTRFLIGYLALWLIHPHFRKTKNKKQELWFALAGLCGITLYYLLENIALLYTQTTNVGVIISIAPFFTALFSSILMKEKPGGRFFYLGFALAMIGILLISLPENTDVSFHPFGDILALLAAIIWAIYSLLCRKLASFQMTTIASTRRTFFYGLMFMAPIIMLQDSSVFPSIAFNDWTLFANLLFLGLGASALCFVTWNRAVSILGSIQTSVYIYLVPVITALTSFIVLQESIGMKKLIGIIFTIGGLFLSQDLHKKETKQRQSKHPIASQNKTIIEE